MVDLLYVKKQNFCFCCRLFSKLQTSLSSESGNSDWKHVSELLAEHEKTSNHMKCFQSWVEYNKRLQLNKTIDLENQRLIRKKADCWKKVLERIIWIIEFLGSQNITFRGTTDKLYSNDNGNFLKLLEFIGKFDFITADHLQRITSKETYVHYLGKNIQNEIISLIGSKIKQYILNKVSLAAYYAIILDCTPDVSHTEQMTIILRYVCCEEGKDPCIKESFLGYVPIDCSTGESLTDVILSVLEDLKIPLSNMRGQGYDNGSNMKGKNVGVQKRILDLNPRAFFVPCCSHSFNLIVNDACSSCLEAVNFFGIIQEIYNYFYRSTYRWSILKKHVPSLTVRPLSDTRWESRIDANGKNAASSLALKTKSFKFVFCLIVWYSILFRVNLSSKQTQEKQINISKALELIFSIKSFFQEMRTESGFEDVVVDAKAIAESIEIEPVLLTEARIRPRKIKRQFSIILC